MSEKFGIAVIGCGFIGSTVAKAAEDNGWQALADAVRGFAAGRRDLARVQGLDDEDRVIAAGMAGLGHAVEPGEATGQGRHALGRHRADAVPDAVDLDLEQGLALGLRELGPPAHAQTLELGLARRLLHDDELLVLVEVPGHEGGGRRETPVLRVEGRAAGEEARADT